MLSEILLQKGTAFLQQLAPLSLVVRQGFQFCLLTGGRERTEWKQRQCVPRAERKHLFNLAGSKVTAIKSTVVSVCEPVHICLCW